MDAGLLKAPLKQLIRRWRLQALLLQQRQDPFSLSACLFSLFCLSSSLRRRGLRAVCVGARS